MKALIENYRGFEIFFDTEKERFTYSLDDKWHGKQSYPAVRKAIDDYRKENSGFKPFKIKKIEGKEYDVVGIRKDGAYVVERNGIREQLSKYDEGEFYVYLPEDESIYANYAMLGAEIDTLRKKRDLLKNDIQGEQLKHYKRKFLSEQN
jgi:hypothetical protein